eukprot:669017-Rhodomonas_salina.3
MLSSNWLVDDRSMPARAGCLWNTTSGTTRPSVLRPCYAKSSTNIGVSATRYRVDQASSARNRSALLVGTHGPLVAMPVLTLACVGTRML